MFLLAHSVTTAAGSFGGGRFADKNSARTLIVATIGAAVCLLALYLVGTIAFLVVLALLAWACSPSAWCPRSSTPRPGPRDRHGLRRGRRSRGRRIPHRGAVPESANGAGAIQPEIADAGEATMAASLLDRYEPQAIIHIADATRTRVHCSSRRGRRSR